MNRLFSFITLAVILTILFFVISKNTSQKRMSNSKLQIVTSFYPLYFFTSEIVGDKATVINVTPAGAEPHDYEPTAQQIATIENSQLVILNGAMEPWGEKIQLHKNTQLVQAGQHLLSRTVTEDGKTVQDPHVWLSPKLAQEEVKVIYEAIKKSDPQNAEYYQKNTMKLINQLDRLDDRYKSALQSCENKDIVTAHAAFGYLAQEYGLNQVAITGVSPDEEPSLQRLAEIAQFVQKNNIQYIFFESLVSPKLAQTLAQETGAQTLVLDPLEGISYDDQKKGTNYFSIMNTNLQNLQTALVCHQ